MDLVEHPKWVCDRSLSCYREVCIGLITGWNSWNHYHCGINETIVRQTADAIVATGLAAAGYQYS